MTKLKKKLSNIPKITPAARKKLGLTGPASNPVGSKPGKGKEKKPPKTEAQKKQERKEKLEALSGILGAAAKLTSGGDAHVGSSSNQDFGRAPIPTGHTAEDFWHPETTESGKVND